MFTRYYDPEIFIHSLDGIDRSNHIVATYFMDDELAGEEFVDHFALIQAMALEGSTGTWEKVAEDTEDVRRKLSGKMVGYFEIPTGSASRRAAVVQLAFPIDAWIDNVPMMIHSGNAPGEFQRTQVRRSRHTRTSERAGAATFAPHHQAKDGHDATASCRPVLSNRPGRSRHDERR